MVVDVVRWCFVCAWLCVSSLQFTGLSVTSGVDQMVALHTSSQDDILLCVQRGELCPNQDRVGELVGTLVDHFARSVPQPDTKRTSAILSCSFLLCRLWNGQREMSFQGHHTLWLDTSQGRHSHCSPSVMMWPGDNAKAKKNHSFKKKRSTIWTRPRINHRQSTLFVSFRVFGL